MKKENIMQHQSLGNRIKTNYENITRNFLPRRTNTIIRIDGKAFHTFTKGLNRPFDYKLVSVMQITAKHLCENIQGARLAYTQSDEINIWVTDYDTLQTDAWFGGNIQKMCSVAASIATACFNKEFGGDKLAMFDARVFTIPEVEEVVNYFIWRQQDASRNSVQMVARSMYSHKECENKKNSQLQEMIHEGGNNWNDFPISVKRGSCVVKRRTPMETGDGDTVVRKAWLFDRTIPIFTQNREYITDILSDIES